MPGQLEDMLSPVFLLILLFSHEEPRRTFGTRHISYTDMIELARGATCGGYFQLQRGAIRPYACAGILDSGVRVEVRGRISRRISL